MVVGLALLVGVLAWKVLFSTRSNPKGPESPSTVAVSPATQSPAEQSPVAQSPKAQKPSPQAKSSPKASSNSAASKKPSAAKSPKTAALSPVPGASLSDRLRKLGVDNQFFNNLVDEQFYAKYPQFKDQKSGGKTDQGKAKWNETASSLMDKLETLSPENRKKMGSYQRSDYDQWLTALGESGEKNSPTLDALADGQLFKLFPDQKERRSIPARWDKFGMRSQPTNSTLQNLEKLPNRRHLLVRKLERITNRETDYLLHYWFPTKI